MCRGVLSTFTIKVCLHTHFLHIADCSFNYCLPLGAYERCMLLHLHNIPSFKVEEYDEVIQIINPLPCNLVLQFAIVTCIF